MHVYIYLLGVGLGLVDQQGSDHGRSKQKKD